MSQDIVVLLVQLLALCAGVATSVGVSAILKTWAIRWRLKHDLRAISSPVEQGRVQFPRIRSNKPYRRVDDRRRTFSTARAIIGTAFGAVTSFFLLGIAESKLAFPPAVATHVQPLIVVSAVAATAFYILRANGIPREARYIYVAFGILGLLSFAGFNVAPIVPGTVGALAALLVGVYNANRLKLLESKLSFVEQQISKLYGPAVAVLEKQQVQYRETLQWVGLSAQRVQQCLPNQWAQFAAFSKDDLETGRIESERRVGMLNAFLSFGTVEEASGERRFARLYKKHLREANQQLLQLFSSNQHLLAPNVGDVPPSISVFMEHVAQLEFRSAIFKMGSETRSGLIYLAQEGLVHFPVTLLLELEIKLVLLFALQNKYRTQLDFARVLDVASSRSRLPFRSSRATEERFTCALRKICKDAKTGHDIKRRLLEHVELEITSELEDLNIPPMAATASPAVVGKNRDYLLASHILTVDWLKRFDRFVRGRVSLFAAKRDDFMTYHAFDQAPPD